MSVSESSNEGAPVPCLPASSDTNAESELQESVRDNLREDSASQTLGDEPNTATTESTGTPLEAQESSDTETAGGAADAEVLMDGRDRAVAEDTSVGDSAVNSEASDNSSNKSESSDEQAKVVWTKGQDGKTWVSSKGNEEDSVSDSSDDEYDSSDDEIDSKEGSSWVKSGKEWIQDFQINNN